jgi:hypothetical protein
MRIFPSRGDGFRSNNYPENPENTSRIIVGSLSESRLKSVRFLVGEISEAMTSYEAMKIIKINH